MELLLLCEFWLFFEDTLRHGDWDGYNPGPKYLSVFPPLRKSFPDLSRFDESLLSSLPLYYSKSYSSSLDSLLISIFIFSLGLLLFLCVF